MAVWRPSVTVAAVLEKGGRFLLVQETVRGRKVLNQPAGHLEPGESLLAACRREVMEETAHHFTPTALVGIYRYHQDADVTTFLNFTFAGKIDGIESGRPLDAEIIGLHWLTPAELDGRAAEHRSPMIRQRVADYLAGRRYPLDILSSAFA